jgi:hypothetical protein
MTRRLAAGLCAVACLNVLDTRGGVAAQARVADDQRQSDVIYGRKFGVALTMEVFRPAKANGAGVVWVVSSNGRSNRDQTMQPSFEQRLLPLLQRGYTVFAVIHGSAPAFHVQDSSWMRLAPCDTSGNAPRTSGSLGSGSPSPDRLPGG